jgi:hypothetical protein
MARRMAVSMTLEAVRERRKTVTRRHVDTWRTLEVGERLALIEKGMGLPTGVEPILAVTAEEIRLEGFDPDDLGPVEWATWWAGSHGYSIRIHPRTWVPVDIADLADIECRRIEWRYLTQESTS